MSVLTLGDRSGRSSPEGIHADLEHLTHDPALVNKIMKKRQAELERRAKLFDPRKMKMGVEHSVLDAQMEEKRSIAGAQAAEDYYHDKHRLISDQVAQVCEGIKQEATRERQKAVVNYSLENLHKETRREYGLSDRNLWRTERAPRDPENEHLLGPSSCQIFEGENANTKERKKAVHTAQRDWLLQQMADKQAYREQEAEGDRLYDEAMKTANEVRGICEQAAKDEARDEKIAEAEENRAMAAAHQSRRQAALNREAMKTQMHCSHMADSDLVTERHDYKLGFDGRLLKTEYKRLTLEEEQDVHNVNARLVLEQQALKRAQAEEEAIHAHHTHTAAAVLGGIESEKERMRLERAKKMVAENQAMAASKRASGARERALYRSFEPDLGR